MKKRQHPLPTTLLYLSVLSACSLTVRQPEPFGEEWPRYWTADDVRRLRPELLDFSQPSCAVDFRSERKFLTLKIRNREDEVMNTVREAMDIHGFVLSPKGLLASPENKYLFPDDIYSCYFMWYGLGTDYLTLVQHYRILPTDLRAFGPPRVWHRGVFQRLLLSKLTEKGLSDSVVIGEASFADGHESEEYEQSTGPEHFIEYGEDGTVVRRTSPRPLLGY